MENMKKYCCLEHVEICMEKVIDEFEQAPTLLLISTEDCPQVCGHCEKEALYVVANDCSDTKCI